MLTHKKFDKLDLISTVSITILGIIMNQVTVFYIIYLFWFQELLRTIIDYAFLTKIKTNRIEKSDRNNQTLGSLFLLFGYFIFIVVLFGFMLNWHSKDLIFQNIKVLLFLNWFFNINLILFAINYILYRKSEPNQTIKISTFNSRHILLHVSIILGAIMQMMVANRLNLSEPWISVLTISPFLLLKILFRK